MTESLIRYRRGGRAQWGIVRDGVITPVAGEYAANARWQTDAPLELPAPEGEPILRVRDVELLSPVRPLPSPATHRTWPMEAY